jgi:hypothetical protein
LQKDLPETPVEFYDYFIDRGIGGPFDMPLAFLKPGVYTLYAEFKKGDETVCKWFDITMLGEDTVEKM